MTDATTAAPGAASAETTAAGDPFASVRSRLAMLRRGLRWYYLVHGICWSIAVTACPGGHEA